MWHLYPNETPPDIPEDEDFGVDMRLDTDCQMEK